MAEEYKTLQTRIKQKYDTLSHWVYNNPILLKGELAIVEIPSGDESKASTQPPAIMFKLGNGELKFNDLPWASAKAADVYSWAKSEKLPIAVKELDSDCNAVSNVAWDEDSNQLLVIMKNLDNSYVTKDTEQTITGAKTFTSGDIGFIGATKDGDAWKNGAIIDINTKKGEQGYISIADFADDGSMDVTGYYQDKIEASGGVLRFPHKSGTIAVTDDIPDAYTLPIASSDTLGGIKTGYATSGKNYKVQVDSLGNAYVNVPWTEDTDTTYTISGGNEAGTVSLKNEKTGKVVSTAYVTDLNSAAFRPVIDQDHISGGEDEEIFSAGSVKYLINQALTGKNKAIIFDSSRGSSANNIVNYYFDIDIKIVEEGYVKIPLEDQLYIEQLDGSSRYVTSLEVGDTLYTISAFKKDWFLAMKDEENKMLLFYPISADMPNLENYIDTVKEDSTGDYVSSFSKQNDVLTLKKKSFPNFIIAGTTYSPKSDGDINFPINVGTDTALKWGETTTIADMGDGKVTFSVTMPTNPNTHYTSGLYVGASNAKSNAAVTSPYLKLYDDSTKRAEFQIKGGGATTVASDSSGNITISSTNTNTWRAVQINGTEKIANTNSSALNFKDDTYTTASYDSGIKIGLSSKVVTTDDYLVIDCGDSSTNI